MYWTDTNAMEEPTQFETLAKKINGTYLGEYSTTPDYGMRTHS